jgi:hypothetical protein
MWWTTTKYPDGGSVVGEAKCGNVNDTNGGNITLESGDSAPPECFASAPWLVAVMAAIMME